MFLTNKFSIELKNGYPSASFDKHLKNCKNDEIKSFWIQANRDANAADKYPMLIFKKKGNAPLVGVIENLFKDINISYLLLRYFDLPNLQFFNMEEFFSIIKENHIKEL